MFLSMIIPVYNTGKYLKECLDSCVKQDISSDEYEIICVNDGSTDNSLQIIEDYASRFSNIKLINQKNGGVSRARNTAIDCAEGDYVWFIDSDDIIKENCLGKLKSVINTEHCDLLLFRLFDFNEQLPEEQKKSFVAGNIKSNNPGQGIYCRLFKRRTIQSNNLRYADGVAYAEDTLFIAQFMNAVEDSQVCNINDVLYACRANEKSATHRKDRDEKKLADHAFVAVEIKKIYDSQSAKKTTTANDIMFLLRLILIEAARMNNDKSAEVIKYLKDNNMFPMKKLKESTLKKSYAVVADDLIHRIIDFIFCHSNTRIGFALTKLFYKIKR